MKRQAISLLMVAGLLISAVPLVFADGGSGYGDYGEYEDDDHGYGNYTKEHEEDDYDDDDYDDDDSEEDDYGEDDDDHGSYVDVTPSGAQGSYTLSDVASHDSNSDCWVIINSKVYDITPLVNSHSGGNVFDCGGDNTALYDSRHASTSLISPYRVGTVLSSAIVVAQQVQQQVQQQEPIAVQQQEQVGEPEQEQEENRAQEQKRDEQRVMNDYMVYEGARNAYLEAKQKNSADMFSAGKTYIGAAGDIMVAYTASISAQIGNSTSLELQTKTQLLTSLRSRLQRLKELRDESEESVDMAQLRLVSAEMESEWTQAKLSIRGAIGRVWVEQTQMAISSAEQTQQKVVDVISTATSDTAELSQLSTKLESQIRDAKESNLKAQQIFSSLNTAQDSSAAFLQAKSHVGDALSILKRSRDTLREIVTELHGFEGDEEDEE